MDTKVFELGRMVVNHNIQGKIICPSPVFASRHNTLTILMQLVAAWQSFWNKEYCYIKEIATKFSEKSFQPQNLCLKTFRKDVSVCVCVCLVDLALTFLATNLPDSIKFYSGNKQTGMNQFEFDIYFS